LTDSAHFFNPTLTASSMLVFDAALSSMILATDIGVSPFEGTTDDPRVTPA
jgi:hypothetical protein